MSVTVNLDELQGHLSMLANGGSVGENELVLQDHRHRQVGHIGWSNLAS